MLMEKTFISLFGGIGGFDLALTRKGWKSVWYNDFDKYAVKTYNKNFGTNYEPSNITGVDANRIPDHTLLCAGFPCQSFSIAGKRKGFADTRGTMFFEICRIIKAKRTPFLLLENVKGLLSHDEGRTFTTILSCLDELGYDAEWQVLNSKHFSVPQNRERVFIIANLRTHSKRQVFPITEAIKQYGKESDEEQNRGQNVSTIDSRYGSRGSCETYVQQLNEPKIELKMKGTHEAHNVYGIDGIAPTVREMHGKVTKIISHSPRSGDPEKGGTGVLESEAYSFTIDSTPHFVETAHGISRNIRRLTPLECERLQSFPDGWTEGASDSQRYKQLGNAVTVNVIEAIIEKFNAHYQ